MAVIFGVFDPNNAFAGKPGVGIDHYMVPDWNADLSSLTGLCNASRTAHRIPLVTVGPAHNSKITRNAVNTLNDIAAGKYDSPIRNLATALNIYNGPVYLRWGPEMDDPANAGRFDWAVPTEMAGQYIAAYQRFYNVFSSYTNHLTAKKFLWSPVYGERALDYYPGNSFSDYIGSTIYVWQRYTPQFFLQTDYSFSNLFGQRYAKLSAFGKPIVIAEMGFEASDDQATWVAAMKASLGNFPLLNGAVWTNARDTYPWVPGGPIPDWTIDPALWHNP